MNFNSTMLMRFGGKSFGRTILASTLPGIHLDGTTEDTIVLQTALNTGNIHLIVDGPSMWDTLYLESNTTLELQAYTYTKKPAPNSGAGFIRNKNKTGYPTTPIDKNITIIGIDAIIDGNRRNGGGGNVPGTGPLVDNMPPGYNWSTLNPIVNSSAIIVSTIEMWGVSNFQMYGTSGHPITIKDSPAYGIHLSNVKTSQTSYYNKTIQSGDTIPGNDAWHLNGGCDNCQVNNLTAAMNDDCVAFNANDGQDLAPGTQPFTFDPAVVSGPITNCHASNITATGGNYNAARFISARRDCYIDNCSISGFTGATPISNSSSSGIFFDAFGVTGTGDIRNVSISGVSQDMTNNRSLIEVNRSFIRKLSLDTISTTSASNFTSLVAVDSAGTVAEIVLTNSSTVNTPYLVSTAGILNAFYRSGNTQGGTSSGETTGTVGGLYGSHPGESILLVDTFSGSSGTALVGHTPDIGTVWSNSSSDAYQGPPVSDIRIDGTGRTYNGLGATGSSLIDSATSMYGIGFSLRFKFQFLSAVGLTASVALYTPPTASVDQRFFYDITNTKWVLSNTGLSGGMVSQSFAFPTAGTEIEIRIITFYGSSRYVYAETSTDGGVTWSALFGGLLTLTADSNTFRPGLWFDGNVGPATGIHVGNIRVGTITEY